MSTHEALQIAWFLLIGVLFTGYAVLDGFDLGVGFWHLFARADEDRRTLIASIGPVWDGNEVWLLTGGGALFAAFPRVYATAFSGMYLALVLLLLALILRAVSIEFRGLVEARRWRRVWDTAFAAGSVMAALLLGIALGNGLRGLPLEPDGVYRGGLIPLLNTYSLLVGALAVSLTAMHGALYLAMKTGGELHARVRRWAWISSIACLASLLVTGVVTMVSQPRIAANFEALPVLFAVPATAFVLVFMAGLLGRKGRVVHAFAASSLGIAALAATAGVTQFPHLLPAAGSTGGGLTIANSSSSETSLTVMLILAGIGMPAVIAYTIWVYWRFRGRTGSGASYT